MSENGTLDLGLLSVEAVPVKAFAGHAKRVYATEREALIDKAQNELANIWLKNCGVGAPTFVQLMTWLETNPDLAEAAAKLAKFKSLS